MAKLNIKNGVIQDNSILGTPIRRGIVKKVSGKHIPGTKYKKTSVTIHETGNRGKTATAEAHRKLLETSEKTWNANKAKGKLTAFQKYQTSYHFSVDDKEIVQCVSVDETSHCQGHSTGNKTSISIEICVNEYNYNKAKHAKAEENAAKLAGSLLETLGISSVVQHNYWTGKNCPEVIRKEKRWDSYKAKINSYKGKQSSTTSGTKPPVRNKELIEGDVDVLSKQTLVIACNEEYMDLLPPLIKYAYTMNNGIYANVVVGKNMHSSFNGYKDVPYKIAITKLDKTRPSNGISSYCNYAIVGDTKEEIQKGIAEFIGGARRKFEATNFR